MQTLNAEQIFLLQFQKHHTSSSPLPDSFLNKIINSKAVKSQHNHFFNICISQKIDIFPAICQKLKETENIKKIFYCNTISYFIETIEINKIKLSDDDIKTISDTKISFQTESDALKCEILKLKFISLIQNEKMKTETALEKISYILKFSDSLLTQRKILKLWNSMNLPDMEIKKLVPILFDQKDFFSCEEKKFLKIDLDCNKLAYDLNSIGSSVKKMCIQFIETYENNNFEHINLFEKNKESQINIYFSDYDHVKKFKFFLDHFSNQIGASLKSDEAHPFLTCLSQEWDTIEHQYKLENILEIKKTDDKKLKI